MADENQNLDVNSAASEAQAPTEATQEAPATQAVEEKVLKQSEVNRIVGGAKVEAYEKGKREALAELERERASQQSYESQTKSQNITANADELRRLIAEEAEARANQQRAQQVAEQFISKMQLGMQKHQDFEEVVTKLDIPNLPPQLIAWANSMDNTADVMYEIGKNPGKFANLLTLSITSPRLAYDEFIRLSDSIKRNEEAAKKAANSNANEPLDQVKHSTTGTDNGSPRSVSDFRKQPWLRG